VVFSLQAFVEVVHQIKRDPYLALHARYYIREVRVGFWH
jgi:hypothetical protein